MREATACIASYDFDYVVCDVRMPDGTGQDVLKFINGSNKKIPLVFITAFADMTDEFAISLGALAVYHKPSSFDDLRSRIRDYFTNS